MDCRDISIVTGYPLDQSGRLISLVFFYATSLPLYGLARIWFGSVPCALLLLSLLVLDPVFIFWSRAFLIETTVLFLSACFLYFFTTSIHNRRIRDSAAAIVHVPDLSCEAAQFLADRFRLKPVEPPQGVAARIFFEAG